MPADRVSKLYYMVWNGESRDAYEAAFDDLAMDVDGEKRWAPTWEDWAITIRIDYSEHWQRVWEAVSSHRSQLPHYDALLNLPDKHHRNLWGIQAYYRVFSLINGGNGVERDLFEGLRDPRR